MANLNRLKSKKIMNNLLFFKKGKKKRMLNQDMLDALTLVSFMVGVANYNENLTQNDKQDLMRGLDRQTQSILTEVEKSLNEQNVMLREILSRINKLQEAINAD